MSNRGEEIIFRQVICIDSTAGGWYIIKQHR